MGTMEGSKLAGYAIAALSISIGFPAGASEQPRGPYQGIVDRNAFGLKSPPIVNAQPPTNLPTPAPKVFLTGITTILGRPQALFKVQVPARPGQPATEQSYILTEGQKEGELEVLKIDDIGGTVEVNNYGTTTTLDINRDSPKLSSAPTNHLPQAAALVNSLTNPAATNAAAAAEALVAPPALPQAANGNLKPLRTRVPRTGATFQPPPPPPLPIPQSQMQPIAPEEQSLLNELERQATNQVRR